MKILDLFCCCGGMSKGFVDAGHEVTGVDITDNHQYPYDFIHSDVFKLDDSFFDKFDLIHASPPCQYYSSGTRKNGAYRKHPDLIPQTRLLLQKTGKPFIIENVIGAPLRRDIILCGEMFGLRVLRHRIFEIERFLVFNPPHMPHKNLEWNNNNNNNNKSYYATLAGHGGQSYSYRLEDWQKAIGIDWITKKAHLTQAVPPEYAEYISRYIQ